MHVDPQTGVAFYQFVIDRLDDRRRQLYPKGGEEYAAAWAAAHGLEKEFATAVHADELMTAEQLLQELVDMAAPWREHPHYPANQAGEGAQGVRTPGTPS
ncbi:hypothetical protein [Streptomyces californicus]|uniref:hypothetical protein n=1 Tax=Streptomyces californicus TaxID=67351 RepID=UPI0033CF95AC